MNHLWTLFSANNSTNNILMSVSIDGFWATSNTQQSSKFAPSCALFNGQLYFAFIANNSTNSVLVCSTNGQTWTNEQNIGQSSAFAPSLAVFNNQLYIAFIANNSTNSVLVCSTTDGQTWTKEQNIGQSSAFAPSLAVFNNQLYIAFIANNSTNSVLICSTTDGQTWTKEQNIGQSSASAPTLAATPFAPLLRITNPASWMTELLPKIGNQPLYKLCLPGSHDSGMNVSAWQSTYSTVGGIPATTITQSLTIQEQLNSGVRYFDLRPVIWPGQPMSMGHFSDVSGSYQGALGVSLQSVLEQVAQFCSSNPKEFVILNFSHDYQLAKQILPPDSLPQSIATYIENINPLPFWSTTPFNTAQTNVLFQTVQNSLANCLIKSSDSLPANTNFFNMTLSSILQGGQVLAIFSGDLEGTADPSNGCWPASALPIYDSYADSNEASVMAANQLLKMQTFWQNAGGSPPGSLFLFSWTLTQSPAQAGACLVEYYGTSGKLFGNIPLKVKQYFSSESTSLVATSVMDLANQANRALMPYFKQQIGTGEISVNCYPNIILTDNCSVSTGALAMSEAIIAMVLLERTPSGG